MKAFESDPALLVIDVQQGFDQPEWGTRNNPDAEKNIARLLSSWRRANLPLFHVKHNSLNPSSPLHAGTPGNEIKADVRPLEGEPLLQKSVNSAFIGTDLEDRLHAAGVRSVILTGLTTNHCVETTARMAANLGFDTWFVSDATATFDRMGPDGQWRSADDIQKMTLTNLHDEFATIVTTDAVLAILEDQG